MKSFGSFAGVAVVLLAAGQAAAQVKLGVTAGDRYRVTRQDGKVVKEIQDPGAGIMEVDADGLADRLKLRKDDLIRAVTTPTLGRRRIDNMKHLLWTLENSKQAPTEVIVERGGELYRAYFAEEIVFKEVKKTGGDNGTIRIKQVVVVPKLTPIGRDAVNKAKPAGD